MPEEREVSQDEFIFEEAEGDDRREIERAITKLRERLRRRRSKKKKKHKVVKSPTTIPRRQDAATLLDDPQIRVPPPLETFRNWIELGWMTDAVVAGEKTLALKPWTPVEAAMYQSGELLDLFDNPPSRGGKKVAIIKLTQTPFQIRTDKLTKADLVSMGFEYFKAFGKKPPGGVSIEDMERRLTDSPVKLWEINFKLERLTDPTAPIRDSVTVEEV